MISRYAFALGAAMLAFVSGAAHAGPCQQQIFDFDVLLSKKLSAAAAAGKSAAQSVAATTHRQPTPASIERAEVQLGDISAANAEAFSAAMKDAREADMANDLAKCEKALGAAKSMLNP